MKELRLTDKDGNDITLAFLKVEGEDFVVTYDLPIVLYLGSISLLDDKETRMKKMEEL